MKKPNYIKLVFLSFWILQLIIFSPAVRANKVQIVGGSLLVQAESTKVVKTSNSITKLLQKGHELENLGNFKSAGYYYDSAFIIAQSEGNELIINYLKRKKGVQFIQSRKLDSARIYFLSVEEYSKKNGIDSLLADVQLNLGRIASLEGNQKACIDYYDSALELYKKDHDTLGIAGVMNNYSLLYRESGDYDKALESALINSSLLSKFKHSSYLYVNSIISLGNIYEKLGEYDTALAKYEESYKLSNELNLPDLINTSLINRAVVFFRQEKYAEAETEFQRAIKYTEKNINKSRLALLYSNLGIVYRNQGKTDLALESYAKALQISKEIEDESRMLTIYTNLGFLYKKDKNYDKAYKYYIESLTLAVKRQQKEDIKSINENLAQLFEETGDYKQAFTYLNEANIWRDSIINEEKVRAIEDMKAKYEKEKNMAQINSLRDENKINELEKKSIRTERNATLGISAIVVSLLVLILYFFRMKARKNRVIGAQRIQQLEDEKKLLAAQSVIVGQERERKRIAQDLHDGIGALLSTASIHFSVASKNSTDLKQTEMLDKAELLLQQAGGEVRKISQNMMPIVLSKFGLIEALEDTFDKLDEFEDIEVSTKILGNGERLPENTEIMVYRIIQEMVNNTLKHANAKSIDFSYHEGNGVLLIDYKDDGIGFDQENLPHNASLGIYGIQSRIDFLKGKLITETGLGKGVHYQISIPVNNHKQ